MRIIRPIFAVVLGIFLIFVGMNQLNKTDVTCGGQIMTEGDQCRETKHGATTAVRDYNAQKSDNTTTGWGGIGLGALFLIGGGVLLVSRLNRSGASV
ncbi:hypothetical protein GPX89_04685 [Nocardia sp. ET3-3]|uniref:Uncharacterized protein n=1 Tax=Nocardia terrae TaxID=2675851 RepID=A0A7K1URN3_9NOCA|nr:hypothetical protein [Nocardia terrae]MVU76538.1 hypothetical protein [Nocardia terrae]